MKSHQSPWARFVIMIAVLVFSLTPSFPASALTPTADIDIALTGSASRNSAPVIMDFDNDGIPEIVLAGEDGTLYLINGVTNQILWQKNLAGYTGRYSQVFVESGLAAADLDGDGQIELVIATGGLPISAAKPGALIVLSYVGGNDFFALKSGWPQFPFDELGKTSPPNTPDGTPDGFIATPSLGDIDGDGDKEIVIGGMDRRIHAWHHTGVYVNGWPIDRNYKHYRDTLSSAALADLDNDGASEIIVGTNNYKIPACPNPYYFYVLKGDATFFPGWPVETTQNIASSPAVGDLDGDGFLDIVVGTGTYNERCGQQPNGKKVYAWDRNGNPLPGWPQATTGNMEGSPAIGDLDGDGKLDVVIACHDQLDRSCNTIYAWHGNGQTIAGWPSRSAHADWPSTFPIWDSPRLADIDGDGSVEVLITDALDISEFKLNGTLVQPVRRTTRLYHPVGLAIADVDGDNLLETLVVGQNEATSKGVLHIWQETGSAEGKLPWPTLHADNQRCGLLPVFSTISGQAKDPDGAGIADVTIFANDISVQTDSNGNYQFSDLVPGSYTIRAEHADFALSPATKTIRIPPAINNLDFVQVYEKVGGYIRQSNGTGLVNVAVTLDANTQSIADQSGYFEFDKLLRHTYTIEPISSDLVFIPENRQASLPMQNGLEFVALAKPVALNLTGQGNYTLSYSDTQGLPTTITAQNDADNWTLRIIPTLPPTLDEGEFAGHAFEVSLTNQSQRTLSPSKAQAVQLTAAINYSDTDIRIISSEDALTLKKWDGELWQTLNDSCEEGDETVLAASNQLQATLCDVGIYALFGPTERVYLPLVQR